LRQSLSPPERAQLQGWSFTKGACSTNVPHILLAVQPATATGGHLCVASFLLASLFLKSAIPALQDTHDRLVEWGEQPLTFTGRYHLELLATKRVNEDNWNAIVGIASSVYDAYVGSVYFVVAYQMERVLLPNASSDDLDKAAAALVRKANGKFDVFAIDRLGQLLQILNNNPPEAWGYRVPGDGQDELRSLISLIQSWAQ